MKYIKLTVLMMTALLLLTACSQCPVPPEREHQVILMTPCPENPVPLVTGKTGADWIYQSNAWRTAYNKCMIMHNGNVKAYSNKKLE